MSLIKTINFLPDVFRSDTNRRFLGATLDQLVTDSINVPLSGYVGRTFAPTYKSGDNYVPEIDAYRQHYQLEPSVVVHDSSKNILLNSTYVDVLQALSAQGAVTNNHQRLFESEYYSYDGHFDFDKFVNYNNYYWLPNGPAAVSVSSLTTPLLANYTVTRNTQVGGYTFSGLVGHPNTQLTLVRGGTYTFKLDQPGINFWIQSHPGVSGQNPTIPSLSTRSVYGVKNNGADVGAVTFNVPSADAQNFYNTIPIIANIDAGVDFTYSQIQGVLLSQFFTNFPSGLDGLTNIANKNIVFLSNSVNDADWTANGTPPGSLPAVIPQSQRGTVWRVQLTPSGSDYIIQLIPLYAISPQQKVFITSGKTHASTQYWLDNNYFYNLVPEITAAADYLYYQDSANPDFVGVIHIVDNKSSPINVNTDILGQISYVSPNGVVFTNGLKVQFDSTVVPASYAGNQYYVEGVGTSIQLVPAAQLSVPSALLTAIQTSADYITINRASQDLNPWSRTNRWFHKDVLTATAKYNNTTIDYGPNLPGRRAIIEFEPNLQLFNYGIQAKPKVDILTTVATDAFVNIEGQASYTLDGIVLVPGLRIVFANDYDISVRSQVWQVDIELINSQNFIRLIETADDPILAGQNVLVSQGSNADKTFRFNGASWTECQEKTSLNQSPLFDLFDDNGYSFSNNTVYPSSSFVGSSLFGYVVGTGNNDSYLGFPLSYQNFNNIGDILFQSYYDSDIFTYSSTTVVNNAIEVQLTVVNANSGYVKKNLGLDSPSYYNNWVKVIEPSKQYQITTQIYNGTQITVDGISYAFVQIGVLPATAATVPTIKVYINNQLLVDQIDYSIKYYGIYPFVALTDAPAIGDKIDVMIYSTSINSFGYYEVPLNLDYNPLNSDFVKITLGQVRNHYLKLIENTNKDVNSISIPKQDHYLKAQGGTILQHSSPLIYSMAFATDATANFYSAINLAKKEYTRFKNKFLSLCMTQAGLDYTNPAAGVDAILQSINLVKNSQFPWYYSDMVPQGSNYSTITYTVLNARQTNYEISSIFDISQLSGRAVLVYLNGTQLIFGIDYTISKNLPAVIILRSLQVGDTLVIRDYPSTDKNFVPETPAKLGLAASSAPAIYVDDSYRTPTKVIRGHDGSLTPAFNDFRDQYLLELESRIYNNIKANYANNDLEMYDTIPGRFRSTEFSLADWNQLLSRDFTQWAGTNSVNFTKNTWYNVNDPWTWNYSQSTDTVDGSQLQGSWRAIYRYWFDTDTPHLTPWQMLGLQQRPSWWIDRYGPAPYTGANTTLWSDLELGYVYNGGAPYTDSRFARPGLLNFIPVDSQGKLVDPVRAGIVAVTNWNTLADDYEFGQIGPAESAWRRNSEYCFALQNALSKARPAKYFATQIDTSRYSVSSITGQFADQLNRKISPKNLVVNGDTTSQVGTPLRASGYLNWIADYIKNIGVDPISTLNNYFTNLGVQLSYRMAGFSDKKLITVFAEQSSPGSTNASVIIPDNNYQVFLGKPLPIKSLTYSAVIITKVTDGYTVSGYDTTNPYFTVLPSSINSDFSTISNNDITVKVYNSGSSKTMTVPYGQVFRTPQQITDFLISYERYLVSQGFLFDQFNSDLQSTQDWRLSIQEFLYWAQQGWAQDSVVILNPLSSLITINLVGAIVDEITNYPNGSRVLDVNAKPIDKTNFDITRTDSPISSVGNVFKLQVLDGATTIGYARLDLIQYEHTLVFDNKDDFGDIIYVPESGTRQFRLKLQGTKTAGWDGALSATGYIYSDPNIPNWKPNVDYRQGDIVVYNNYYYTAPKDITSSQKFVATNWTQIHKNDIQTGLLRSFGHNAQIFTQFYDVDNPPKEEDLQQYSSALIGFRPRPFLSNLGLSTTTQTKFYQGYIKQKGTKNAFDAMTKATFDTVQSSIEVYEEWAFQVGRYGDIDSNQYREFILDQSVFLNDPTAFTLAANAYSTGNAVINLTLSNVYKASNLSSTSLNFYNDRSANISYSKDLPTVGYVNDQDADLQVFDINGISDIISTSVGYKVWTAKDVRGNWNIFRISETNFTAIKLSYSLDNYALLTFDNPHSLSVDDFFLLKGFDPAYNGMYRVLKVANVLSVLIELADVTVLLARGTSIISSAPIYVLRSMRLNTIANIEAVRPLYNWKDLDRVWVDNAITQGWGVYQYQRQWLPNISIRNTDNTITANAKFGTSIAINANTNAVYVGSPNISTVSVFVNNAGQLNYLTHYLDLDNSQLGTSIASQGNITVFGAPGQNRIVIKQQSNILSSPVSQTINSGLPNTGFGTALALSADQHWLYVSYPQTNTVYAYWTANVDASFNYGLVGTVSSGGISLIGTSQYGASLATDSTGANVFIGTPGDSNAAASQGAVYWFSRTANSFSLTQSIYGHYIAGGSQFGTSIAIDQTSQNLLVGAPGSTASGRQNGAVELWRNNGTFAYQQTIYNPDTSRAVISGFGSSIAMTPPGDILVVSSQGGTSIESTSFDGAKTTIDLAATKFLDSVTDSGSAYEFEFMQLKPAPNQSVQLANNVGFYTFIQDLEAQVHSGDQFGQSLAVSNNTVLIGTPGYNSLSGVVYSFYNGSRVPAWSLSRYQQARVDITSINRTFIYDITDNVIQTALDFIDPNKGVVLSTVSNDIDYQSTIDPAVYNAGSAVAMGRQWGPAQVGQIWWNLDTVRFLDYEQDSINYRLTRWSKLFSGSSIDVYEWVQSPVLPSQYQTVVGDGIPLYTDDSHYSTYGYVNQNGAVNVRYYFWVKNKITVATSANKRNSVYSIAAAIENPQSQGVSYMAALRNDTIALFNATDTLKGTSSAIHVGTYTGAGPGPIHTEYNLVQEGNSTSQIPAAIERKMIDSLAGSDSAGNAVPDPSLSAAQAYGVAIRPRQTLFVDRIAAWNNYVSFVNTVLASYPVVERKPMTTLMSGEPAPNTGSGLYNKTVDNNNELNYINTSTLTTGYNILVLNDATNANKWAIYSWNTPNLNAWNLTRLQSYKTNNYWVYQDWYASGYDPSSITNITVANKLEFGKLTLTANTYVTIQDNGNGQFVIYYIDTNLVPSIVGVQNGTLQISAGTIPALETRQIALAIQNDIFVDDLASSYNQLFFSMVKYALSEQKNLDWVFKTNFISSRQFIRQLQQFPSYVADNQQYYLDYITEVKPFRTTVREFVVDYLGNDTYGSDVTDFDLVPYWDANLKIYRSPNGSQPYDAELSSQGINSQWYNNYQYKIANVLVENGGSGFLSPPQISFVGGGGTGAAAYATINGLGQITAIIITNPGSGYTSIPTVGINGTGSGAIARAVLRQVYDGNNSGHNVVRSIRTNLKFDRVNYTAANTFVFWNTLTAANAGANISANTILVNNNQLYVLNSNVTVYANLAFPLANTTPISISSFNNANDRIIAFSGNIDLTLTQSGLEFPGVKVLGNAFKSNSYSSTVQSFYSNVFGVNASDMTMSGGAFVDRFHSYAPEELVPGRMFDSLNLSVYDTGALGFRIFANMAGQYTHLRIANANTTTLTTNLAMTDNTVYVSNALTLPTPNITLNNPGVVIINGEKIIYWRNFATETKTAWAADTLVPTGALITYLGNVYLTTGNVYDVGGTFSNISANVYRTSANAIYQIRRGADATVTPNLHVVGSRVVDASTNQLIPNSTVIASTLNSNLTVNVTAISSVSFVARYNNLVTANIGDLLTQKNTAGYAVANLICLGNVSSSNLVPVTVANIYTGNVAYSLLANTALYVNGITANANLSSITGLGTVSAYGNVTLLTNTTIGNTNCWYTPGAGTATNGLGLDSSTTSQANFLKASVSFVPAAGQTP
jgi:hypothetical protein